MKQLVLAIATTLGSLGLSHVALSGLECWTGSSERVFEAPEISPLSIRDGHWHWPHFHPPCFGLCTEQESSL
jgi:hypothetical protein